MSNPLISIIIPTHNEEEHLEACLKSLLQQSYKNFEVIIVDDGSTDNTKVSIHRSIETQSNKIKLFQQKHQGPGAARNLGAKKSRGDILVFVDADMTFDTHFIDILTLPLRQNKTIGTFTKEEVVSNNHNVWAKSWSLLRGWPEGKMHPKNSPEKQPVFRAILRKEFLQAGGFDTNRGYDDDWSLSEKLAVLATNAPGAIIYHANPNSLQELFTQSRWIAKRRYKFGFVGKLFALLRVSLPISKLRAIILTIKHTYLPLFPAVLISDFGQFIGLAEHIITHKTSR